MNKIITALLVVAGVALSSTASAAISQPEYAGICAKTHLIYAGVAHNTGSKSDLQSANRSMIVFDQLNARWGSNPQYKQGQEQFMVALDKILKNNNRQEAMNFIGTGNRVGCQHAGVSGIQ